MNDWTQTLSIIATMVATFYYFHRDAKSDHQALTARTDAQMARIDQLYQMYVDIMKEIRDKK